MTAIDELETVAKKCRLTTKKRLEDFSVAQARFQTAKAALEAADKAQMVAWNKCREREGKIE